MADDDEQESRAESSPRSHEIHKVIREEGEEDLERNLGAIAWSGLAAGLSMGFSFLTMAILSAALPDTPWRSILSAPGYTLGFLIVVLGKQQLFTESTLTAVLPVLSNYRASRLGRLLAYWLVVLVTNLVGTLLFAALICHENLFEPRMWEALRRLGEVSVSEPFWPTFVKAILAGWLIALMIWLLPSAGSAKILVILVLTFTVAAGKFSHTIAGSVEAFFAVFSGEAPAGAYFTKFLLPTLLGNTIGGVALVALLNHAPLATEGEVGS